MRRGGGGEEKNEGTLDGVEENGVKEGGERKDSRVKQTVLLYVYI